MTEPVAFATAHQLLDKDGLRAKKQVGQTFLISERVCRAIVDATVVGEDHVVGGAGAGEVGR